MSITAAAFVSALLLFLFCGIYELIRLWRRGAAEALPKPDKATERSNWREFVDSYDGRR